MLSTHICMVNRLTHMVAVVDFASIIIARVWVSHVWVFVCVCVCKWNICLMNLLYLLERIWWTNDQHFPFVYITLVNQASWETLDGILVQLCKCKQTVILLLVIIGCIGAASLQFEIKTNRWKKSYATERMLFLAFMEHWFRIEWQTEGVPIFHPRI